MADIKKTVEYVVKLDGKITSSFKKVEKSLNKVDKQVTKINKTSIGPKVDAKSTKGVKGLSKSFDGLTSSLKSSLASLTPMGAELSAIAGPIGIAAAAIAAIGVVLFSTASAIEKVDKQVRRFTDSASEVQGVSDNMRALQKTFEDVDIAANLEAANVAAKEFGIPLAEAQKLIEKATVAGGGIFDPETIKEYSSQMKDFGMDAEETFALVGQARDAGLNVDKSFDTLKEFGLSIREMTKAQEDALTAAGFDPNKITADIESGAKTQREVFNEIFSKEGLSKKQEQTLVADLLKGAGEDLGKRGVKILATQTQSLDELVKKNAKLNSILERNKRLTSAQGGATRRLVPVIKAIEAIWTEIQIAFFEIMDPITEMLVAFGKMIFESNGFKLIMFEIGLVWKIIVFQIKLVFKAITFVINLVRGLARLVNEGLLMAFNKVKEVVTNLLGEERVKRWKDALVSAIEFVKGIWTSFAKGVTDLFEKVANFANGNGFEVNAVTTPGSKETTDDTTTPGTGGKGTPGADTNQALMNNTVGSTTQAEVKQINITIDKLQEIGTQTITGQNVDQFKEQLQQALASIIADTSQL